MLWRFSTLFSHFHSTKQIHYWRLYMYYWVKPTLKQRFVFVVKDFERDIDKLTEYDTNTIFPEAQQLKVMITISTECWFNNNKAIQIIFLAVAIYLNVRDKILKIYHS